MTNKPTLSWLVILTSLALIFLSANSILAKAALLHETIDAYSFTFFRIIFGAVTLLILLYYKRRKINLTKNKNWISSFMLFLYAISFSYAYLHLDAGFGALVLFGAVQLTMIFFAIRQKEKVSSQKIIGTLIAFAGLVYLLFPHKELQFALQAYFLMITAGIAWAIYTIVGKRTSDALYNTTDNFVKATFFTIVFYIFFVDSIFITANGILLAMISGSLTSAIGYVIWYFVLPKLQIITASIIQLIVPVIAIFLSILILDEKLTFTLILSTIIILSGIVISTAKVKRLS